MIPCLATRKCLRRLTHEQFHNCAKKDLRDHPPKESHALMDRNFQQAGINGRMIVMTSTYCACMLCQ